MNEAKPTKRYRVRNYGMFAGGAAGSLGDGRYIGMIPGTTGTGSVPDKSNMRDFIYYVPDGLPEGDVKAFYIPPSLLEEWDGEPCPGMVFRYNSNGEQIAEAIDLCECGASKDPVKYGPHHLHDCPAFAPQHRKTQKES